MRLLLATTGSDGDLQPFYALAQRLIQRGHDVTLAANNRYQSRAAELGIPFVAVGPPWDEAAARALFTKILAERQPLKQLAIVMDGIVDDQRATVPELIELVKTYDVVVYPPLFIAAVVAARAANKPHVSAQFAPVQSAVSYGPTGRNLGRLLNRFGWWAGQALLRRATDDRLNTIVAAGGLPPWRNVLMEAARSELLDLVAVSPQLLPKDPSWDERTIVTGYWFVEEKAFSPDPQLASFVANERVVVVGFGSMMGLDAKKATEAIVEAARAVPDRKIVMLSGWAGLGAGDAPKNLHVASFVPHAWLLSRASCIVHHGGAGTTAAALRAGIPQAIVWHLGDQPAWGRRIADAGLGPPPRSHHDLDGRWLARAIERMTTDDVMAARAREIGEKVRAEDGLAVATRALEALRF